MSKNRLKATIAGSAILVGLLASAGVVYATTNDSHGSDGCGAVSGLSKAVGPNGNTSIDVSYGNSDGGPLCVAPVAPVAPISH